MVEELVGHKETEAEREIWVMYTGTNRTQQNRQNSLSPTVSIIATTRKATVSIKNKFTYHLRSRRLLSDKMMLLFQTEIQKEIQKHPSGKDLGLVALL